MYQTGGLFHPLLSQRIYQSNQGLKLSAKAFWPPEGAFICLKSLRLPNGSKVDIREKRSNFPSGWGPDSREPLPPSSATPPTLSSSSCLYLAILVIHQFPKRHQLRLWISADRACQMPGLPVPANPLTLTQEGTPWETRPAGRWQAVWWWRLRLLLLLLPSDRQSCLTLIAISAAEFPAPGLPLYKIAAGCHWTSRGGSLPVILLLVPHVKLWLPRRQL